MEGDIGIYDGGVIIPLFFIYTLMGKLFRYDSFCNLLQETTRHRRKRKRKVVPQNNLIFERITIGLMDN